MAATVSSPWYQPPGLDIWPEDNAIMHYAAYPNKPTFRASGYALNGWVVLAPPFFSSDRSLANIAPGYFPDSSFVNEGNITRPSDTPVFVDGAEPFVFPTENEGPPFNLIAPPFLGDGIEAMRFITIARHGNRPSSLRGPWPADKRMPGGINVAFFDGHAELVPLERLWSLYWHLNYQPPAKRPGLL